MTEKCRGSQTYPQERSSKRRFEKSEVIKLTETASQDQIWLRTLEQFLDETRHESHSRFCERIRELRRNGKKEKNPSIFVEDMNRANEFHDSRTVWQRSRDIAGTALRPHARFFCASGRMSSDTGRLGPPHGHTL